MTLKRPKECIQSNEEEKKEETIIGDKQEEIKAEEAGEQVLEEK